MEVLPDNNVMISIEVADDRNHWALGLLMRKITELWLIILLFKRLIVIMWIGQSGLCIDVFSSICCGSCFLCFDPYLVNCMNNYEFYVGFSYEWMCLIKLASTVCLYGFRWIDSLALVCVYFWFKSVKNVSILKIILINFNKCMTGIIYFKENCNFIEF